MKTKNMNTKKIEKDLDRLFDILNEYADDMYPEAEEAFDEALFIGRQLCEEVRRLQGIIKEQQK